MNQIPHHITENLKRDKDYYSLYRMENIERCKVDESYLGDVLLVNEDLIWHSVHKYIGKPEVIIANNCIDKDDILQLGRLGFIKSIYAFETSRGIKFSSFSVTAIVREIRCFLRDSGSIIRPTRTANELIHKINRIDKELGYTPPIEELAEMLGSDVEKVTKAIQIGRTVKYLDEPVTGDSDTGCVSMLDYVTEDFSLEEEVLDVVYVDSLIDEIKDCLSEKEESILRVRLSGLNQTQTAEKEDVSQMRVNRVMRKVAKIITERNIQIGLGNNP